MLVDVRVEQTSKPHLLESGHNEDLGDFGTISVLAVVSLEYCEEANELDLIFGDAAVK